MTKISLALAAALIGSALVSTAEARGCGGGYSGFGGGYSRSYQSSPSNLYARRQAVAQAHAKAKAQAAARARQIAAKRDAAASVNVAKADPATTEAAPTIVIPDTPTVVKAETAATPAPLTTAALTPETDVKAEVAKPIQVKKAEAVNPDKKICRKFSAAINGLVEVACE